MLLNVHVHLLEYEYPCIMVSIIVETVLVSADVNVWKVIYYIRTCVLHLTLIKAEIHNERYVFLIKVITVCCKWESWCLCQFISKQLCCCNIAE